jgi:hypothetical protein
MLELLQGKLRGSGAPLPQVTVSERKKQLFCCACNRHRYRHRLEAHTEHVIDAEERHADGLISEAERQAVHDTAATVISAAGQRSESVASYYGDWSGRLTLPEESDLALLGWALAARAVDPWLANLIRDMFGNPFRPVLLDPAWRTATVVALAQAIYDERAFARMPILGDALEDAGCGNVAVLNHCRQPGEHFKGCWLLDLLLGKA